MFPIKEIIKNTKFFTVQTVKTGGMTRLFKSQSNILIFLLQKSSICFQPILYKTAEGCRKSSVLDFRLSAETTE